MSIPQALVDHHGVLRQLFEQSRTNIVAADDFIRHLTVHHTMEEKYFYDILQWEAQAHKKSLEAVNEHHIIEMIIKELQRFPREHEQFLIKVEPLGEYTNHHLDEEETVIFPMAEQVLLPENQATLGTLFSQAKTMLLGIQLPPVPGKGPVLPSAFQPNRRRGPPQGPSSSPQGGDLSTYGEAGRSLFRQGRRAGSFVALWPF